MSQKGRSTAWWLVWIGATVLFVVHHDFWYWNDRSLVFGFLPIGLAYHALFSIASGLLWLAALKFAWPSELEAWAEGGDHDGAGSGP